MFCGCKIQSLSLVSMTGCGFLFRCASRQPEVLEVLHVGRHFFLQGTWIKNPWRERRTYSFTFYQKRPTYTTTLCKKPCLLLFTTFRDKTIEGASASDVFRCVSRLCNLCVLGSIHTQSMERDVTYK